MSFNKKAFFILAIIVAIAAIATPWFLRSKATADKTETKVSGNFPPAPTALMQADLTKLDGSKFKLADYKGKVILVNVWATWCGPCRMEIPELVELQTKLKDKGFEVIGLNLDEEDTPEAIQDFSKEFSVNYEMARGDMNLFKEFYSVSKKDAIPQSFLIDREGKLNGVFVGGGNALKRLIDSSHKLTAE